MFKIFKNESQMIKELINKFDLPKELFFGSDEMRLSIPTYSLIEKTLDSQLKSTVSDAMLELILEKLSLDEIQPILKKFYQRKINSGDFILWNNARHYYGLSSNVFLKTEISYYLIDDFIKSYEKISNSSIESIKQFIRKEIEFDEIVNYSLDEDYYRKDFFKNLFESSLSMLNNMGSLIKCPLKIINDDYEYDLKKTFRENLKNKIENTEDVFRSLESATYEIESNGEYKKYSFKGLIDFNSINGNSIFLNIEDLPQNLFAELIFTEEQVKILLFNYEKSVDASKEEYETLFKRLSKN